MGDRGESGEVEVLVVVVVGVIYRGVMRDTEYWEKGY